MTAEESFRKILEHLKEGGPLNTFRLARNLDLDRSKLLNFIEELEQRGAVEVQHGSVRFLKFVGEEKKAENQELKEKILQLESKVEELEKTASAPPKIIERTIVKTVPVSLSSQKKGGEKKRVRKKKKIKLKKIKKKSKKFKLPKFSFLENIKQLKKPEFAKK